MASLNSVCPHGCWRARLRKGSPAGLYVRPCPFWSPLMMFPSSHSALATLASSLTLTQVRRLLPQGLCTCCSHCLEDGSKNLVGLLFASLRVLLSIPCSVRPSLAAFLEVTLTPSLLPSLACWTRGFPQSISLHITAVWFGPVFFSQTKIPKGRVVSFVVCSVLSAWNIDIQKHTHTETRTHMHIDRHSHTHTDTHTDTHARTMD